MIPENPEFLTLDQCLNLKQGYLVTVNMQHIYEARRLPLAASAIFDDAAARYCLDGRGAAKLFERVMHLDLPLVQGNVLLDRWLSLAARKRLLVIGSSPKNVEMVMQKFPDVEFVVDSGNISINSKLDAAAIADSLTAAHSGPWDLIAVALGVPKQELLAQALHNRMNAPIFCIGGSFEILGNTLPRSPRWIQVIGMEGIWRLALEPSAKRIDRIVKSYATFFRLRFASPSAKALTGLRD